LDELHQLVVGGHLLSSNKSKCKYRDYRCIRNIKILKGNLAGQLENNKP